MQQEKMKLNTQDWKWFEVGKILVCNSTKHSIIYDQKDGSTPLVSRSAANNGITALVDADMDTINNGNCITIGAEGLYAFYQPRDFVSGVKVYTLRHNRLNPYNALFLCVILNREVYRYSYGNARILEKIKKEKIKLPVTPSGEPDWKFMEDYIKSLPFSKNIEPSKPNEVVDEVIEMKKELIKMRKQLEAQQASQEVKIIGGNVTYIDNSKNYNIQK